MCAAGKLWPSRRLLVEVPINCHTVIAAVAYGPAVCGDHNTKMPHPAFGGQMPDEMSFGTGSNVPEELVLAKSNARAARLVANRALTYERCLGQQATLPEGQAPRQFPG
jgi:hypothetical protein